MNDIHFGFLCVNCTAHFCKVILIGLLFVIFRQSIPMLIQSKSKRTFDNKNCYSIKFLSSDNDSILKRWNLSIVKNLLNIKITIPFLINRGKIILKDSMYIYITKWQTHRQDDEITFIHHNKCPHSRNWNCWWSFTHTHGH